MKNKKTIRSFSGILFVVLIFLGIGLFSFFQFSDKKNLQATLEASISFAQNRISRYSKYQNNDKVKSLVRLQDKTLALTWTMKEDSNFTEDSLKEFAEEQSLTGILVLDENLNQVMDSSDDGNSMTLWKDMLEKSYITDILPHPEKSYITRVTLDDTVYDFAAVSRRDITGLVIAYVKKTPLSEADGELSIKTLMTDFPFEMKGVIVITKDGEVVGSNHTALIGTSVEDCQEKYKGSFTPDKDGIVKLVSGVGHWYGRKDAAEDYTIYMFYPASQVFMTRNIVSLVYVLVALVIYLIHILGKGQAERRVTAREQKRLRIINSVGQAYSSILLLDLKARELEVVKASDATKNFRNKASFDTIRWKESVAENISESYRKEFLDYINLDTVVERLEGQKSLSFTSQKNDGSWILSLIIPQRRDKEGVVDAILIANRDVTKDKEREMEQDEALRSALAAAKHASKAKSTFLNSMSHDIRTPMNAIIGFTALAQTHIDNQAQVQDYLSKISTSSTHLLSLINDILDMSRIESGTVKLDEKPVHIPDLLHDLRAMIQGLVNAKNLNLYIDAQDVVNEDVITDKLRLNQVLLNIISNAIKFTEPGGDIIIRLLEKPCEIKGYTTYELTVKDNGIGMSEEFLDHVFDTFAREQSSTVSGIQGTGLGMAISKNIVEMMGGEIKVESQEGKGSIFTVILNLKIAKTMEEMEPIPELLGARALVVDDDINTCRSVSKMLWDIKMRPDWTTSGKEAVVRAQDATERRDEYKVYIIDYLMPDVNGIETVRRIRKVISEEIPIIVLTAYDWADLEYEAREAGVTAFVSKPLFMSELRNVLRRPVQPKAEPRQEAPETPDYSGKRVLLVEDNELNREIATTILEETGMWIDSVEDGDVAVATINQAPADRYDLILMDIQMPKMDGYTATREIRTLSDNKKANIPIVAMTANAFEEDKQRAYKAGMNGHIIKPITMDEISRVLDKVFKK